MFSTECEIEVTPTCETGSATKWLGYVGIVIVYMLIAVGLYHSVHITLRPAPPGCLTLSVLNQLMEANRLFRRGLKVIEIEEGNAQFVFEGADADKV